MGARTEEHALLAAAADAVRPHARRGAGEAGAGRCTARTTSPAILGRSGSSRRRRLGGVPARRARRRRRCRPTSGRSTCAGSPVRVDTSWRRTSYSALSAAAADPGRPPGSAASRRSRRRTTSRTCAARARATGRPSALPSGGGALADGWAAGGRDLRLAGARRARARRPARPTTCAPSCARTIDEQLVRWPVALDADELADALVAVCDSPLGPLADGRDAARDPAARPAARDGLRAAARRRRRRAATRPPTSTLGDVAPLLRAHLPAGDPLLPYADALGHPALGGQDLRGYLTGSVDVVLRVPGGAGSAVPGRRLQDQLARRVPRRGRAGADLRRLPPRGAARRRWGTPTTRCRRCCTPWCCTGSCAGGSPATTRRRHLGGVLYLYLRGMCGPDTPVVDGQPCGVFSWRPPVGAGRGALRPARRRRSGRGTGGGAA